MEETIRNRIKEHMSRYWIWYALGGIILVLCLGVFVFYLPLFQYHLSGDNSDWGNFGQFFWGLGTMLLTGLNVFVFYRLTTIVSKQEQSHQQAYLRFEMLKVKLQKQKELIDDFCKAELFAFTTIDDENGGCVFDSKRIENAMELFSGLNEYGDILTIINSAQYRKTYERLCGLYSVFRSQDEENELVENWEENVYALYNSLRKIEKQLKREHIDTLSRALDSKH